MKRYNPTTSSIRHRIITNRKKLSPSTKIKGLFVAQKQYSGRDRIGQIRVRRRGGGHKQQYRIIDFKHQISFPGYIRTIEYDPNRTAHISLVEYLNGTRSYVVSINEVPVGTLIQNGTNIPLQIGNSLCLKELPIGCIICNIELNPNQGAKLIRAAGTYGQIISKEFHLDGKQLKWVVVLLQSGQKYKLSPNCKATIGSISNPNSKNQKGGKAGWSRWLGKRPSVRGVAMNPVDHPHGGGEGKTSGGRISVTPAGKLTKGVPTRKRKKRTSNNA